MTKVNDNNDPTKAQLKRWLNQSKIVFASFFESPKTMFMVERETKIMRPSICRFVSEWRKKDSIRVVKTDLDPYTKCKAGFLSTNPIFWPKPEAKSEQVTVLRNGQATLFQ